MQVKTRPDGDPIPLHYEGPGLWSATGMRASDEWRIQLGEDALAEIGEAARESESRGIPLEALDRRSFPLPRMGPVLTGIRDELVHGRGFVLLRGLPVGDWPIERLARAFLGMGAWIGRPVSQNAAGHILGHVRDLGHDVDDPRVRTYQTTARQYFHADSCDIVGLLCLKGAREGGESAIASSVHVYNRLAAERPELARALSRPMAIDRRGEVPRGRNPWFTLAVFNHWAGLLSTYYARRYLESAQRFPEAPRLTEAQREGFDLLDAIVEEPEVQLRMELRPGDIQLLHNHTVLHDRMGFLDWPEPGRKRHLLRLWLCPPNGRPLHPAYADRWGSIEPGARGGIVVPGTRLNAPLEPV